MKQTHTSMVFLMITSPLFSRLKKIANSSRLLLLLLVFQPFLLSAQPYVETVHYFNENLKGYAMKQTDNNTCTSSNQSGLFDA